MLAEPLSNVADIARCTGRVEHVDRTHGGTQGFDFLCDISTSRKNTQYYAWLREIPTIFRAVCVFAEPCTQQKPTAGNVVLRTRGRQLRGTEGANENARHDATVIDHQPRFSTMLPERSDKYAGVLLPARLSFTKITDSISFYFRLVVLPLRCDCAKPICIMTPRVDTCCCAL